MKILLISIFLLSSILALSQDKPLAYISLTQHSDMWTDYTETDLSLGINIPVKDKKFYLFASYQFGGNYKSDTIKAYMMNYHLLGGGLKFRFRSADKIYSPTVKIQILTEIVTNYAGKKLGIYDYDGSILYFPLANVRNLWTSSKNSVSLSGFQAIDFISIPLVVNVLFGNELRVAKDLYLNLLLGYQYRAIRVYEKTWASSQSEPKSEIRERYSLKNSKYGSVSSFHNFEFGLGINYFFSFKTTPKPPRHENK